jgi:hypothetical protein
VEDKPETVGRSKGDTHVGYVDREVYKAAEDNSVPKVGTPQEGKVPRVVRGVRALSGSRQEGHEDNS